MASFVYNAAATGLVNGTISFTGDTIKARLCVAGTPNKDDTSMTGQTAASGSSDLTVTTRTVTNDGTNDRVVFDCDDLSFTGLAHTGNATHIAIFKFVTNDAGSTPLFNIDITDLALTPSITTANYAVPATGVAYLQQ